MKGAGGGGIETRLLLDDSENFQVKEKVPRLGECKLKISPLGATQLPFRETPGGKTQPAERMGIKAVRHGCASQLHGVVHV